jgi:hypothetical protein
MNASMTAVVPVPEASVDEDDLAPTWKYEVRASGQITSVKPKPVAESMRESSDDHLGACVLATNA